MVGSALNWIWVGVIAAIVMYQLAAFFNLATPVFLFIFILQAWSILFFACFGLNRCRKQPFRTRTVWIALACSIAFDVAGNIVCMIVSMVLPYSAIEEVRWTTILSSLAVNGMDEILFVLAYLLARFSSEGRSAFTLRWNRWLRRVVVLGSVYMVCRTILDAFFVGATVDILRMIQMISYSGRINMITMLFRGALLFCVGASALTHEACEATQFPEESIS